MTTQTPTPPGGSDHRPSNTGDGSRDDVAAMLEGIDDVPLAERAEAFDALNRQIAARLAEFDGI